MREVLAGGRTSGDAGAEARSRTSEIDRAFGARSKAEVGADVDTRQTDVHALVLLQLDRVDVVLILPEVDRGIDAPVRPEHLVRARAGVVVCLMEVPQGDGCASAAIAAATSRLPQPECRPALGRHGRHPVSGMTVDCGAPEAAPLPARVAGAGGGRGGAQPAVGTCGTRRRCPEPHGTPRSHSSSSPVRAGGMRDVSGREDGEDLLAGRRDVVEHRVTDSQPGDSVHSQSRSPRGRGNAAG